MAGPVRPAVPDDAPRLARVHLACWREAYAHLLSEQFLAEQEQHLPQRTAMWERLIGEGRPPAAAEVDGVLVGLAGAVDHTAAARSSSRHADEERPADLELRMLYLLAAYHGSSLGQQLLDAVVGDRPCFLWVAEENPRARAFYSRNGFQPDGARNAEPSWEGMVEIRMVRT